MFWEELGKHELSNIKPCVPPDFHLGILKEGKLTHTFSTPPQKHRRDLDCFLQYVVKKLMEGKLESMRGFRIFLASCAVGV